MRSLFPRRDLRSGLAFHARCEQMRVSIDDGSYGTLPTAVSSNKEPSDSDVFVRVAYDASILSVKQITVQEANP